MTASKHKCILINTEVRKRCKGGERNATPHTKHLFQAMLSHPPAPLIQRNGQPRWSREVAPMREGSGGANANAVRSVLADALRVG